MLAFEEKWITVHRKNLQLKRLRIVFRKVNGIAFTLSLIVCLLGASIAPGQLNCTHACCVQTSAHNPQSCAGEEDISQTKACCRGPEACSCILSQGCGSKLPEFSVSALPFVQKPLPANITVAISESFHIDLLADLTGKVWALYKGPPLPVYLLNLSMLC